MQLLRDLLASLFPKLCVLCEEHLIGMETILCANCTHNLPIIDNNSHTNNALRNTFYEISSLQKIKSFLYFKKHGNVQQLIHLLKYKNRQDIGSFLGHWFINSLVNDINFLNIDYIIPVPLHPKRFKERGFNQLTIFGETLAKHLNTIYLPNVLKRISNDNTQTFKSRFERFNAANTKFTLTDLLILQNKHVLLIDDVITTGATLVACCKELEKTKNIKISIATMAYTEKS